MKTTALALLTLFLAPLAEAQRTSLIGIFEYTSSGRGDNLGAPGVRVLFHQSGRLWRSYNATCQNEMHDESCLKTIVHVFPSVTTWTLVKQGKPVAKVAATTPAAYHFYSEIGVQAITNPAAVLNLEPRPTPDRPDPPHTVLATTLPTLKDPDNWQPASPFPLDVTHVRQAFHKLYPHPKNCTQTTSNSPSNYHDSTITDDQIASGSSYVSNKNWRILELTLNGYRCDGPPDDAWVNHWFAISPMGEVHHLGRLMHLAGTADFANEGRSEILFQVEGGNEAGYKLFYDNFTHQAQATVTYH
ncbi:hypothetical protein RBB79_04480 [Tunturiibacter empetritectus]|uniref:DUF1036 domain-containing protein n=2 Tax=Tunturiibacter TaxID=3154218 RepID=A0A852V784_9BACT|nr:hypothetical protein [Edaphobacter lichenicola]NYF88773.1 hypothetical protein [Edaphobacter lichenicola]